ncbi:DUF4926 domain-containing protein [Methylobacterium haplocladii]|uniref:DUF4926 domain-containing protein n=1 Tax=Methylobacterium haplocladii TaxID=1176176 RepID=A0A512IVQ5_9HYPH|nr:DUF4926 domain-containing protein [Methylobacterium haplocladii]GEP01679.1 hypothetical protein MHA02_40660 [Methylobacterium haplocladii]GJD86259.1 hypothetical protein HPGCJGGD_4163 [Methylobacterium haplocladii]GLS61560.1 hypothetical protein GCM10007887_42860 [Methylobacterium haplocladii]
MSVEFAYRIQHTTPQSLLRELDDVVLMVAVVSDDGDAIPAGTEGTAVSVHDGGQTCVVEFAEPEGALATVELHEIRPVERAAL